MVERDEARARATIGARKRARATIASTRQTKPTTKAQGPSPLPNL